MFDPAFLYDALLQILQGLGLTLQLLVLSTVLGLGLAILLLLMRISGNRALDWSAQAYIYVFRGTPILVQIFIIYYGFPQLGFIRNSILWPIFRDPFGCAIVALTLNTGAYVAEILRGGVLGVDKGGHEAGIALGLKPHQRFIYNTVPLAVRLSLPAYSTEVISMLKATALASTITLMDMTGIARSLVSKTFAPFEVFITLAAVYLLLTWGIQSGFGTLEKYLGRYARK